MATSRLLRMSSLYFTNFRAIYALFILAMWSMRGSSFSRTALTILLSSESESGVFERGMGSRSIEVFFELILMSFYLA